MIRMIVLAALVAAGVSAAGLPRGRAGFVDNWVARYPAAVDRAPGPGQRDFLARLSAAALEETKTRVTYDPSYFALAYPGGDPPADRGVCTDVVIRAYRKLGVDLQVKVHEDMRAAFASYPPLWGRRRPDANIDHRRVPNLLVFFLRHGQTLPISQRPADYRAGDVVAWDLGGGVTHVGLVVDKTGSDGARPLIVHNIGAGVALEDRLFEWRVIGHFRYVL